MLSLRIFNHIPFCTSKLWIIYMIYIIYLIISQFFLEANNTALINVLFSLIYFVTVLNIASYSTNKILVKYSKYFVWFTIILLTIEAYWRLTHPIFLLEGAVKDYRDMDGMLFYAYKYSSIMFMDSNFVGTYGLIAFFYYYYLRKKICKKYYPLDIIIYSHCRHLVKKCDNYYFYNSFPALFFIGKNQILSYSHNDDFR